MLFSFLDEEIPKRYKNKLHDMEYMVMDAIKREGINIKKRELDQLLKVLYDFRIID